MDEQPLAVGNLRKISLSIEAGPSPGAIDPTRIPYRVAFILGIGSNGFTPFEYELLDKQTGETIRIHVPYESAHVFFGHLTRHVLTGTHDGDEIYMNVSIQDVAIPDPREIIKAMAVLADCGDGCDCGCGCGGQ